MAVSDIITLTPALKNISTPRHLKRLFFPTPFSGFLTIAGSAFVLWVAWSVFRWGIWDAVFAGTPSDCLKASGACWAIIGARWRLMMFGLYPYEDHWRSALSCGIFLVVTIISCMPRSWTFWRLVTLWIVGFALFVLLMRGGVFGLSYVSEEKWGGLTLTVYIFAATVLVGMPMAIGLALMRRSSFFLVARLSGLVIDGVRSLPLITILFSVAVILPIVAPGALGGKLSRVIFGMSIYFAAYQAEIIRSGIQSLPIGQEEAAKALGLHYWQRMRKVILPQAFRRALPSTINQICIAFMEVALVMIVGLFDFVASGNAAFGAGDWTFANVEVYAFIAFVYFILIFALSRYGAYLESRMRVGQ